MSCTIKTSWERLITYSITPSTFLGIDSRKQKRPRKANWADDRHYWTPENNGLWNKQNSNDSVHASWCSFALFPSTSSVSKNLFDRAFSKRATLRNQNDDISGLKGFWETIFSHFHDSPGVLCKRLIFKTLFTLICDKCYSISCCSGSDWTGHLLSNLGDLPQKATSIYEDNQTFIKILKMMCFRFEQNISRCSTTSLVSYQVWDNVSSFTPLLNSYLLVRWTKFWGKSSWQNLQHQFWFQDARPIGE
jgi:hypothetical protein